MSRKIDYKTIAGLTARCLEEGNCLIWQGGLDGHGRPQCRHGGKTRYVRRVLRELTDGKPVPGSRVVAARCGNVLCVSPACSEVATNKRRGELASARGAYTSAAKTARMVVTKAARSRFDETIIARVRQHPGPSTAAAAEVGMSASHAKAIRRGSARTLRNRNIFAELLNMHSKPRHSDQSAPKGGN